MPLLAKVPLTMGLREQSDAGLPIVFSDPDDPAAQALRAAARGRGGAVADRAAGDAAAIAGGGAEAGGHVAADGLAPAPTLLLVVRGVYLRVLDPLLGSWSSAKQASTGHASTQASQSMHSSGSM